MATSVGPTFDVHTAVIEEAKNMETQRYKDEKYEINRRWDAVAADLESARMVESLSPHERMVMRTFIKSTRSIDHTRCSISHCKRMLEIQKVSK
jgi:hypothetical protein